MKKTAFLLSLTLSLTAFAAPKKGVMIAGRPSHGPLSHEHKAGIMLLAKCLKEGASQLVSPTVVLNGLLWLAKVKVPKGGVLSEVSAEELKQNLDPKGQRKKK